MTVAPQLTLVKTVTNNSGGTKAGVRLPAVREWESGDERCCDGIQRQRGADGDRDDQPGYTAGAWGGDCATDGTITLLPGDDKTCTITNTDVAPKLTLVKTVANNSGGTKAVSDFPLFVNGNPVTSGAATAFNANVVLTATETNQPGYTAGAWGGDCATDGTITLLPGDDKTCTITNTDVAPKLTLVKTVANNSGGTKAVSDFPLFVNGNPVTSGAATAFNANVVLTATETNQPGYTAGAWGGDCATDGTITLLPGDDKTCTITNTDVAPKLTLVKTVANNSGGTKVVSDFPLFVNGNPVTSGAATAFNANVVLTATETNQPGYTAGAWGGDCATDGTITLLPGDDKTCTITNTDVAPKLTLVKTVANNSGGTKAVSDFPLFVNGNPVTSGAATAFNANVVLTATETNQPGYTAGAWGGDCATDGTITLLPGDDKTCTITNTDVAPKLTLVKTVVNNNGGTAVETDWTLQASNGTTTIRGIEGAAAVTNASVPAGTYTLSETGPSGYALTNRVCDGGSRDGYSTESSSATDRT